ncbi:MAG: DUF1631 domain-containing protein [Methylococcaceae bacterium]|nr:DUF1631 domain-containing protein [Methylococcaceae bacterium]MCI0732517.1 DUF1631 domain-containing protein [Methylococcaceae bacterium]
MHGCRDKVSKGFAALFKSMLDNVDEILLRIADSAESDTSRTTVFETIQELQLRRLTVEQDFYHAIAEGFHNFDLGKIGTTKEEQSSRKLGQLSLVDKDDFEVTVEITTIVTNAQNQFSEHLYALNHRLAVINGGTKLGERSAALPAGPMHLCEAFLIAVDSLALTLDIKIPMLKAFQRCVVSEAGPVYDEFNSSLARAGVLPNLTLGIPGTGSSRPPGEEHSRRGSVPPTGAATPNAAAPSAAGRQPVFAGSVEQFAADLTGYDPGIPEDEDLKQALFEGISRILAHRRHGRRFVPGQIRPGYAGTVIQEGINTTNLAELVLELNRLQQSSAPSVMADQNIHGIRDSFAAQIEKLGEILSRKQVTAADADVIDLVGMLFEMILDDETLPDAVKALLSHLHTPFLKIAVLDKKFFVRGQHPARRLLNAMSQAGSLCSGGDGSSLSIISKMRDIVNRIVKDFQDNTEIFSPLLDEFTAFMTAHHRRSIMMEKRAVEAAKGREKLQSARRTVSHEIVNRLVNSAVPKAVESLLMGPWANYLVITILRSGEQSQEWASGLEITDELIWSVKQKTDEDERNLLRLKLPKIVDTVKAGLEIAGDIESDVETMLRGLEACHKAALAIPRKADSVAAEKTQRDLVSDSLKSKQAPVTVHSTEERVEQLKNIIPEEWRQALAEDVDHPPNMIAVSSERQSLIDSLRHLEFGTWFEFFDEDKEIYHRGKLAWINTTTSKYMFVNQGGRQIAVKSLQDLADDLEQGRAKIIELERLPFVDRALKSIQELLKNEPSK